MARAEWLFSTENTRATSFMLGHEEKKKVSALTEGPTFPWGPASPGRPVRPCQRKSTVEIQMSHQTSPCRHVLNKGRNIWHCGKLGSRLWLAPCARSNSSTPADENWNMNDGSAWLDLCSNRNNPLRHCLRIIWQTLSGENQVSSGLIIGNFSVKLRDEA